jgi:Flp pilus assembly protein TadD
LGVSVDEPQFAVPPPDPQSLLNQTYQSLQVGDIAEAGLTIRQAVDLQPNDPQIRFTMAIVLSGEHRYPEAVRMLDRLSKRVPETRLPALGQTAEWLVIEGKWQEAESRFRQILRLVPDAAMAHRQLAQLLVRQGRRLEAAAHIAVLCQLGNVEEIELRTLLSLTDPFAADSLRDSFDPIGPLGRARWAISQDDWELAETELLADDSTTPNASALQGRIYARRKELASLESWTNELPEEGLPLADAWFARGVLAASQSEHRVAVRHFCRAVILDPTDAEVYERMAESLAELESSADARNASQRASVLRQTQEIGRLMAGTEERDPNLIAQLSESLRSLRRPFEALAWQAVGVAYAGSRLTPDEQQRQLNEINERRLSELRAPSAPPDDEFICCGLTLP